MKRVRLVGPPIGFMKTALHRNRSRTLGCSRGYEPRDGRKRIVCRGQIHLKLSLASNAASIKGQRHDGDDPRRAFPAIIPTVSFPIVNSSRSRRPDRSVPLLRRINSSGWRHRK